MKMRWLVVSIALFSVLTTAQVQPDPGTASVNAGEIVLEGSFLDPVIYWEDLNGDGVRDVWVRDKTHTLWLLDGATTNSDEVVVHTWNYPDPSLAVKPRWHQGIWRASAHGDGLFLLLDERHWRVAGDDHGLLHAEGQTPLSGGRTIHGDRAKLLPVIGGYALVLSRESQCIEQLFQIAPALSVQNNTLRIGYPLPRWQDLNRNGTMDLIAGPVDMARQGRLGLWRALDQNGTWVSGWSYVNFDPNLEIAEFALGDLNGDGFDELVVLARPTRDMSLFDELTFLVYLGNGPGQWDALPIQNLKSKQNLWQTGPIEITPSGIRFYYYKGFMRSRFSIDFYAWNQAGFVEPKPTRQRWRLKDARRSFISLDLDVDQRGGTDLILRDDRGIHVFFRAEGKDNQAQPFSEERGALLWSFEGEPELVQRTALAKDRPPTSRRMQRNRLTRLGRIALVDQPGRGDLSFWTAHLNPDGTLEIIPLGTIRTP